MKLKYTENLLFRQIPRIKLIIFSMFLHQLVMVAALNNASLLQNHNAVAVADGGESVGNDKSGAAVHQLIHTVLHDLLGSRIDRGGRFVKDQDRRICDGSTGDGEQLALSLALVCPITGQHRVIAVRKLMDKRIGIGELGSGNNFLICGIKLSIADIFHHRCREQMCIL